MKRTLLIKSEKQDRIAAYFSMEIGLDPEIPTYSGGLGILAGDTIKAFADLHIPTVGLTLLARKGYFRQKLDASGWQSELPFEWDVSKFMKKTDVIVEIALKDRKIKVAAWEFIVKGSKGYEVPVYFLDTDLPENSDYDRTLTNHLYGGDDYYRMCQEIVLGIGGVRILEALGFSGLEKFHMNEGHAAFISTEIYRKLKDTLQGDDLLHEVRKRVVFTTHTPVPAGIDNFPLDQVKNTLSYFPSEIEPHVVRDGRLSMILLALYFSNYVNGVAKKHGEVSQLMFPEYPIDSITNGVHSSTWTCKPMQDLFDKFIPGWRHESFSLRYAIGISRHDILEAHEKAKADLIKFLNDKGANFNQDVFTIGFARRATAYKRPELLFHDFNRLREIAKVVGRIQIVFGGKAHPKDQQGKEGIRRIFNLSLQSDSNLRLFYLEDYDMANAKFIVSGVDLWLNTPVPPWEASGTSGMKAAHNGVPQLSTLDGWWLEGHIENETGWSIGKPGAQRNDASDAGELYYKLERIILPMYYTSKKQWANVMRHCIAMNGSFFNTHRMVEQYVVHAYFH